MVLILALASIAVASLLWPELIGAGFSPTPRRVVDRMLRLAQVGPRDVVYDLGCGDGRIVLAAARRYGARAVGIEADPFRYLVAWTRTHLHHLGGRVRVVWGDYRKYPIQEATVVTLFLSEGANRRLKDKLLKELRDGARVVSYYWAIPGWTPSAQDQEHRLYLYRLRDVKRPD